MSRASIPYKSLCAEYYELDKPSAPEDALLCYLQFAKEALGPILEPMCGTGRFLTPLLAEGYSVAGFDSSSHMLEICRRKCKELQLPCRLWQDDFETFSAPGTYNLIFIPSGSFCLLTNPEERDQALGSISKWLKPGGKFVFEVETLKSVRGPQYVWNGSWVNRPDGTKIVLHTLSSFDSVSNVETTLCKYELWEENLVSRSEVEVWPIRRYEPSEIEHLLTKYGLKVAGKWQAEPHAKIEASAGAPVIMYECVKLK